MTRSLFLTTALTVVLLLGTAKVLFAQTLVAEPSPSVPSIVEQPPPSSGAPAAPSGWPSNGFGAFQGIPGVPGFGGSGIPQASYRITWLPDQAVVNQPTHLGVIQEDASISSALWHDGCDTWSFSAHVRGESFFTHAVLPDSGKPFPDELWSVRFGTTYAHQFDNGWTTGGGLSVGSASDELFHSTREMTLGANGFLVIPQGEHNAWLFTLMYSPTSEIPFPIPGVAYLWQPSDCLRVNVGLPFAVMYRPVDDLTLDFSYMLLRTMHARAMYHLTHQIGLFSGFDWSNESYFLVDRPETNDRFFYYDKRASAGVQVKLGEHVQVEMAGGYEFDRFYFDGVSYSDRNQDRVDVNPGAFLALQGRVHW